MTQGLFRDHRIRGRRLQRIREAQLFAHPLCAHCSRLGVVREAVEVDHIIALANGGQDIQSNRQSLCMECHAAKTAADLGYRVRHGGTVTGESLDPNHHWNTP